MDLKTPKISNPAEFSSTVVSDGTRISKKALKPLLISAINYGKKYKKFIKEIENPNFILKETSEGMRKGWKIIEEMKRDAQVGSDLRTLKGKIKGLKWSIQIDSDKEEDHNQAELLRNQIEPIYRDLVTEILEAVEYGYAIVEKNWAINKDGLVVLSSVKGHDQDDWTFDENGTPGLKTSENPEPTAVEMERIIHATFDAPRGNPFGRSVLIEAFWAWYWKKHCILFWAIHCEKFGQPTIIGFHEKTAEDEEVNKLLETLESIQSDTAVTLEKGWQIEFMEAKRSGQDSYEAFVKYCDRQISKAILSAVLTTNESQYGARAHATEQKEITDEVLEGYALRLQDIVNKDAVHLLVKWNYKFTIQPNLYIHYDAKTVPKEEAEGDEIQQKLMPISLDDFYKKYGWTKPDGNDLVIFNGTISTWDSLIKRQANQPSKSNFSTFEDQNANTSAVSPNSDQDDSALFLLKEGDFLNQIFVENQSRFNDSININGIIEAFDVDDFTSALPRLDNTQITQSQPVWEEFLELAGCLAEYSILHQTERIQSTDSNYFSKEDDLLESLNLLDMDYGIDAFKNITPKQAINWFKSKVPVSKEVWEALRKELKNNAFYLAKIDDIELKLKAKEEMLKSLEEGIPYQEFKKSVQSILDVKKLNAYLRTSFNTNMFSALSVENEQALLRNTDMFPYWRYSTLIDIPTHTCNLCRRLHNFTARYDHPAWSIITPPNHHNCKCRKVIATPAEVQRYLGVIKWNPENPSFKPIEGFDFNPAASLERVFKKILLKKSKESIKLNAKIREKVTI